MFPVFAGKALEGRGTLRFFEARPVFLKRDVLQLVLFLFRLLVQ